MQPDEALAILSDAVANHTDMKGLTAMQAVQIYGKYQEAINTLAQVISPPAEVAPEDLHIRETLEAMGRAAEAEIATNGSTPAPADAPG